jgi:hypothetical protein
MTQSHHPNEADIDKYDIEMFEDEQLWSTEYDRGYAAGRLDRTPEQNPTSSYLLGYDFGQEDRATRLEELFESYHQ